MEGIRNKRGSDQKNSQGGKNIKSQNSCVRRPYKQLKKEVKGKIYPYECRVPNNSKER